MEIVVNGKRESIDQSMSILQYLSLKGLDPNRAVVEHNYTVVKKEEWGNIILKENDQLEVLRFVGGG
ncbi:sulfur carrier protein [Anaerosolibacter carboniphilus]|uniref:Sulfur carrier protein n=1 Tax=Anaerosolibacter carboniphilus TaxID=1417629 RepID=A0A841L4K0_9FIRM|nr:sulfur carrier protein ThiS [Anaerosolibacter carboniphilus]MBB6217255.1 sulfur carrier protein [Anaerosolibacter carboniphilus]